MILWHNIESDKWKTLHFEAFDVEIIKKRILLKMNITSLPCVIESEAGIRDWSFIISFLGNDFLPEIVDADNYNAFNILIERWKTCFPVMGGYITNKSGEFNLNRLQKFLENFKQVEIKPNHHEKDVNPRDLYYLRYLGIQPGNEISKRAAVQRYLEGLEWNQKSLLGKCPSWEWYYPHYHPPYLEDIMGLTEFKSTYKLGVPRSNLEYLVIETRNASCKLLPGPIRHLIPSQKSPIIDDPIVDANDPTTQILCKLS